MRAEEIREKVKELAQKSCRTTGDLEAAAYALPITQLVFTAEIAAQLAELNQNLRDIHPELNMPEECRKHTCDYHTGYLAYGAPEMSHEAYHLESKRFEEHLKLCAQSTSTAVCVTCTRWEKRLRA